jgi:pilus assembly protein CpaB
MNKRLVAVVATIVLAVAGVSALLLHTRDAEERAFEGAKLVPALRLVKDVPAGASVREVAGAAKEVKLPRSAVPTGALVDLGAVDGKVTTGPMVTGEVLIANRFASPGTEKSGAGRTGLQHITIQVGLAPSVGGVLEKDDTVGIIGNYGAAPDGQSGFLAQSISVVRAKSSTIDGRPGSLVTLKVDGKTALKISNAASFGTIWLTLQDGKTDTSRPSVIDQNGALR